MSKAGAAPWHEEFFETEEAARAYSNECYKRYCNLIELYVRTREGYRLVQAHREHWRAAAERWARDGVEEAPYFG